MTNSRPIYQRNIKLTVYRQLSRSKILNGHINSLIGSEQWISRIICSTNCWSSKKSCTALLKIYSRSRFNFLFVLCRASVFNVVLLAALFWLTCSCISILFVCWQTSPGLRWEPTKRLNCYESNWKSQILRIKIREAPYMLTCGEYYSAVLKF